MADVASILPLFSLQGRDFSIEQLGTGHIHQTFLLKGKKSDLTPNPSPKRRGESLAPGYILQRVNKNVFKQPDLIAANLRHAGEYIRMKEPNYNFLTCIPTSKGLDMAYDTDGFPWRLFPYIQNSATVDKVSEPEEAFEAAREFAKLTRVLDGIDVKLFQPTIPNFHDLALRKKQFLEALSGAGDRAVKAKDCIDACSDSFHLVEEYDALVSSGKMPIRIVHNDTKINNVLFDKVSRKTVSVIDLDTLMPGYFIYDLGDMVRTFVPPVSEEEKDLSLVGFRKDVYDALLEGYLSEMNNLMTASEREAIPFAGKMMTYIMALRFLTDYLRGNEYYHVSYPEQNLVRAANQLRLLEVISVNV